MPAAQAQGLQSLLKGCGVAMVQPFGLDPRQILRQALHRQLHQQQGLRPTEPLQWTIITTLPDPQQQLQGQGVGQSRRSLPLGRGLPLGAPGEGKRTPTVLLEQGESDEIRSVSHDKDIGTPSSPATTTQHQYICTSKRSCVVAMEFQHSPLPLQPRRQRLTLPLAGERVAAGFPSPADDYVEVGIDLNEQLIRHPTSTFFLRVSGDSMTGAGIQDGDLLVVDRSLDPRPGRVVVAVLDGGFTLKRLTRHQGRLRLEAANPDYPALELHRCGDVQIWGVAIHVIHPL